MINLYFEKAIVVEKRMTMLNLNGYINSSEYRLLEKELSSLLDKASDLEQGYMTRLAVSCNRDGQAIY